jgi:hypothetical protein
MSSKCITKASALESKHNNSDYFNNIIDDIYNNNVKLFSTNKLKKIDNEIMCIPNFSEHNMLLQYNYNVQQLKSIVSHYKLKMNGNKTELITRIYSFLYLSNFITRAQKWIRGYLLRKYNKLHGPGFKNKNVCTNTTDFFTMDPLTELSNKQFFSFEDADGFIYGFDLLSIYNLIYKCDGQIKNPYNRLSITSEVINNFRDLLKLSKMLKYKVCIDIKNVDEEVSVKKMVELRALTLFQNMDALGNYTNSKWFMDLSRHQLVRVLRELLDIWTYRAPLTIETKREICPPNGNPFPQVIHFGQLSVNENIDEVRRYLLVILEKFVNSGIDRDNKCLGAYYVIGAITLVNAEAASSLPWLYQAFSYMQ